MGYMLSAYCPRDSRTIRLFFSLITLDRIDFHDLFYRVYSSITMRLYYRTECFEGIRQRRRQEMNTAIKGTYRARLGAEREAGRAGRQEPGAWRCRAAAALGPAPWVLGIAFVVVCLVSRTAGAVPLTTLPQVVAVSGAVAVTDTKATPGATT